MAINTKKIYLDILYIVFSILIISFLISGLAIGILYSGDTIAPFDTAFIMPAKSLYNGALYTLSQLFLVFIYKNFFLSLVIAGIFIISACVLLMLILKNSDVDKNFKLTRLFAFTLIMLVFFTTKLLTIYEDIVYFFSVSIRYDLILFITTFILFFPACIFILSIYLTSLPNEFYQKKKLLYSFSVIFLVGFFCFAYYLDNSAKKISVSPEKIFSKKNCKEIKVNYIDISTNTELSFTNEFGEKNICQKDASKIMNYIMDHPYSSYNFNLYRYLIAYYSLNNDLESLIKFIIKDYKKDLNVNAAEYLYKLSMNRAHIESLLELQNLKIKDKTAYSSPIALFYRDYNNKINSFTEGTAGIKLKFPEKYNDYSKYFIHHPGKEWIKRVLSTKTNFKTLSGKVLLNNKPYAHKNILLMSGLDESFFKKNNTSKLEFLAYNMVDNAKTSSDGTFTLKKINFKGVTLLIETDKDVKYIQIKDIHNLINSKDAQTKNLGTIQLQK